MLSNDSGHTKRFQKLLEAIGDEVHQLKQQVNELKEERNQLQERITELEEEQSDVFSPLKETDRMAMKHQIKGLISKIDEHLANEGN